MVYKSRLKKNQWIHSQFHNKRVQIEQEAARNNKIHKKKRPERKQEFRCPENINSGTLVVRILEIMDPTDSRHPRKFLPHEKEANFFKKKRKDEFKSQWLGHGTRSAIKD